ncbi:MAG: FAD-dependent oxidoreductase [Microbacterium sp.]|uniref:protoporphyrinogen/coproporphyrinogen oxidase n=1 Tax=Microbacterium sp. TaxID=51671 RepID=UPI0039E59C71
MTDPAESEAARAAALRVVVVGGGIAGLVAALQCAKIGLSVTVVEASDRLGGVVRSVEVAGLALDVGAESFATRGGAVRALIDELGLGDDVVEPAPGGAWVAGLPGGEAAPLPAGGVLGIPANPFADDVRRVLGTRGAWRAYADRFKPVLTIGRERSLGKLVRARLGDRVVERLVAPVTSGVYSAHPDDIDVDVAAPGLNSALSRSGSLLAAVALLAGRRDEKAPGSAVGGVEGGMSRLVAALGAQLEHFGASVVLDASVSEIVRDSAGRWAVVVEPAPPAPEPAPPAPEPAPPAPEPVEGPTTLHADAVIVATPEPEARRLLGPLAALRQAQGSGSEAQGSGAQAPVPSPRSPIVEIVTLVLDAPALDARPRGTGVLTVPGSHRAKALTHSTAKWPWLARLARGRHVVRVSFGSQDEPPATADLDDDEAVALAVAEASTLLGVPLEPGSLVAGHRERFAQSQPGSAIGQADAAARARAAVSAVPGLGAVGAWLAGTGLAQVVPDALAEGDRVRRAVLWG